MLRRLHFVDAPPVIVQGKPRPYHLLNFEGVREHAVQTVELKRTGFMPPWLPEPGYGEFIREPRLTEDEKLLLQDWLDSGAMDGDAAGLPEPPTWTSGWQLRPPDLVLESPANTLSSSERGLSRNFVISVPHEQARWVKTAGLHHLTRNVSTMRGLASTIIAEFMFNNSADNAKNPHHPPRRVVYGNKADDEMGNIFLQVTPRRSDQRA